MFYSPSALSPISPIYPSAKEKEAPPIAITSTSKHAPPAPVCEMTPPASSSSSLMDERMSAEVIFERPVAKTASTSLPSDMETASTAQSTSTSLSSSSDNNASSSTTDDKEDDDEMDIDSASSASSVCEWTLNIPKPPSTQPQIQPATQSHSQYTYSRLSPSHNTASSTSPSSSTPLNALTKFPIFPSNASPLRPNLPLLTLRIPNSSLSPTNKKPVRQFEALRLMVNASPYPRAMNVPEGWGRS